MHLNHSHIKAFWLKVRGSVFRFMLTTYTPSRKSEHRKSNDFSMLTLPSFLVSVVVSISGRMASHQLPVERFALVVVAGVVSLVAVALVVEAGAVVEVVVCMPAVVVEVGR